MVVPYSLLVLLAVFAAADAGTSSAGGCAGLTSRTLDVQCTLAGEAVNCNDTMEIGTTAELSCRPGFKLPETYTGSLIAHCTRKSQWSRSLFDCVPDCGQRIDGVAKQLSVNGKEASAHEFPWHVALFLEHNNSFLLVCGGTLVTPTFVITAAHCVWDEGLEKKTNHTLYHVAAGKQTLAWETVDPNEQRFQLKATHVPIAFLGLVKRLDADIAVLELSAAVTMTFHVNLICMDWRNDFEFMQLSVGNNGTVPGWGFTESNRQSDTLRYVELPFVPFEHCQNSVPTDFQTFLTSDKICGGFLNRTISVCQGDSGGGFVFATRNVRGDRRYFLRAVVSSRPGKQDNDAQECASNHFSTFTRISAYLSWIQGIVFATHATDGNVSQSIEPPRSGSSARKCRPLTSSSLDVHCTHAGEAVNCKAIPH